MISSNKHQTKRRLHSEFFDLNKFEIEIESFALIDSNLSDQCSRFSVISIQSFGKKITTSSISFITLFQILKLFFFFLILFNNRSESNSQLFHCFLNNWHRSLSSVLFEILERKRISLKSFNWFYNFVAEAEGRTKWRGYRRRRRLIKYVRNKTSLTIIINQSSSKTGRTQIWIEC